MGKPEFVRLEFVRMDAARCEPIMSVAAPHRPDAGNPPAARGEGQPDGTHGEAGGGTHRVESTARTPPRRRRGYNEDDDLVTKQVCEMAETEEDPDVRANLKKRCRELRKE